MPGETTNSKIKYAIPTDEIRPFPAEVSQPGAETIDAYLFTKILTITKRAAPYEAKSGELGLQESNAATTTLPSAATKDQLIAVFCAAGATSCKITTSGGAFVYGKWITLASKTATVTLTEGMCAVFQSNGTNWLLLPGSEIKNGNNYGADTERIAGTEYEPSATRDTEVFFAVGYKSSAELSGNVSLHIGGKELPASAKPTGIPGRETIIFSALVLAGQKWEIKGNGIEQIQTCYLIR